MTRPLNIAMLGARGVPATFGGIEHHVEQVGRRLVERGHHVTVFCESAYVGSNVTDGVHEGMRLVRVPSVRSKHFEALAHAGKSTARVFRRGFDIVHYHAVGPGVFSFVPRWFDRAKVVQTIHGLDADRAKWSRAARTMLRSATWLSARVPDATVVVSRSLAAHYLDCYGRRCAHIPNGVERRCHRPAQSIVNRFGLHAGSYALFVGRLVPEKCPHLLIEAYRQVSGDRPLVIAGGTSYSDDYMERLSQLAAEDPRVRLIGYLYGEMLEELYSNAAVFVLPSALEGLPLTMLEAISAGVPVIASDIPPHVEIVQRSQAGARLFACGQAGELAATMERVLAGLGQEREGSASLAESVHRRYDWDRAVDQLEAVFYDVTS